MSNSHNYVLDIDSREIDRSDEKWLHPLMRGNAQPVDPSTGTIRDFFDKKVPLEQRRESVNAMVTPYIDFFMSQVNTPEAEEQGTWETFTCDKGCDEEPDAPAFEIFARVPKNPSGERMPVVFFVGGGALAYSIPKSWVTFMLPISMQNNAVVVNPRYRPALEAPYPAAINDLQAAYEWVIDHADELNVDPDKVVITGESSGGHLATALCFRLKRKGYTPRGCVTTVPITDDRMTKRSSRFYMNDAEWDGVAVHLSAAQWLGDNVSNPLVGPEAFANHATVEDCRGLCPQIIITLEMDPDCDYSIEFIQKCMAADVFCDLHVWGGNRHGNIIPTNENAQKWCDRALRPYYEAITDCIENDLRRPWTVE